MSSAASDRPARWAVLRSLRELTRLAVTALVLAVGLGGALAATSPPAPTQLRPSAVSSRVDTLRTAAGTAEQASRPVASPPSGAVDNPTPAVAPVTVRPEHGPAVDPGRGVPSRRGPPTR
ncbi:hypothetical protein ACFY1S_00155 [Micromonospora sp. NPDC000663]|uniref:hypothetical protein n=1 Tax=Micromonospora sp. NPDC000663 TaxID=3364218 RepID=UPI0036BE119E